jgi:hypothetical protein
MGLWQRELRMDGLQRLTGPNLSDSDLQDLALIPRKDLLRDADQPEILSRVQESPRAVLADGQTDPGSFDSACWVLVTQPMPSENRQFRSGTGSNAAIQRTPRPWPISCAESGLTWECHRRNWLALWEFGPGRLRFGK